MQIRTNRRFPDGEVEECLFSGEPGSYRIEVRRAHAEPHRRDIPGAEMHVALAGCPEIVGLSTQDCLAIECDGPETRRLLRTALVDREPDRELDEAIWPAGAGEAEEFFWYDEDIDPGVADLLRLRWLAIDGTPHAALRIPGRTVVVPVVDGTIGPDTPLISASWYSESAVTSFQGANVAGLIGDDLLLTCASGDVSHAELTVVSAADLPDRVAGWLGDTLLARIFLLGVAGAPGLTPAEAEGLVVEDGPSHVQVIRSDLDAETAARVVEALRAQPQYRSLHDALLAPDSADGRALYRRLRGVLAGEEELVHVLHDVA